MQTSVDVARLSAAYLARNKNMINCHAFGSVPAFAQGPVRDLRVRRALQEADLPYRVTRIGDAKVRGRPPPKLASA